MSQRNRKNMPVGFEPPVPAWSADWAGQADTLTTAVFGVQGSVTKSMQDWVDVALFEGEFAPELVDIAQFIDLQGIENTVYIAYWRDDAHQRWWSNPEIEQWWQSDERLDEGAGYWYEYYTLPVERMETLHSTPNSHGVATLAPQLEGPIDEHAYPGAARDRIAVSGKEDLSSSEKMNGKELHSKVTADGKRVQVTPPPNMCVIRSGQDWGHCEAQERDFYLNQVHPSLIEGMAYLSQNPKESRCLSMRLMQGIDAKGKTLNQTFGLGYGRDIFAFEEWAKSHPTHLKIFDTFMTHAASFGENMQLRLWHEVSVLGSDAGQFVYINCHADTGLLPYC